MSGVKHVAAIFVQSREFQPMFGGKTDSVLARQHDCLGQVGVPVLIELCAKCGDKSPTSPTRSCQSQGLEVLWMSRCFMEAAQHLFSRVSSVTVFWCTDLDRVSSYSVFFLSWYLGRPVARNLLVHILSYAIPSTTGSMRLQCEWFLFHGIDNWSAIPSSLVIVNLTSDVSADEHTFRFLHARVTQDVLQLQMYVDCYKSAV